MASQNELKTQFETDDASRAELMHEKRKAAALTLPHLMPRVSQTPDRPIPNNYQSTGSHNVKALTGSLILAIAPPGVTPFGFELNPEDLYNPSVPDDNKQDLADSLLLREVSLQALFESSNLSKRGNRRPNGFRRQQLAVLDYAAVFGDVLTRVNDDFSLRPFRLTNYVTKRDSSGNVLYHSTSEQTDPLELTDRELAKSKLTRKELQDKKVGDRMMDLWTMINWEPESRKWRTRQEVNGHIINERDDPVSRYIALSVDLADGDNYGHSIVEQNLGDLFALNQLCLHRLQLAYLASYVRPAVDENSSVRFRELKQNSGVPLKCRVRDGKVEDLGVFSLAAPREYAMINDAIGQIEQKLGKAFLSIADSVRNSERTTGLEVQGVMQEIDGVKSTSYTDIADDFQLPLVEAGVYLAESQKLMTPLEREDYQIRVYTGLDALARSQRLGKILTAAQIFQQMGPEMARRIDQETLGRVVMRYSSITEPGLIKDEAQVQRETQEQLAVAAQAQAQETGIQTAGRVVEAQAQPQGA